MPLTSTTAAEQKRGDDHSLLIQRHLPRLGYCTLSLSLSVVNFLAFPFHLPSLYRCKPLPSHVTAQSVPPSSTIILPTPKPNGQNHTPSTPSPLHCHPIPPPPLYPSSSVRSSNWRTKFLPCPACPGPPWPLLVLLRPATTTPSPPLPSAGGG